MSRKSDYYGHVGGVGIEGLFSMYPMAKRVRSGSQSQDSMSHSEIVRSTSNLVSRTEYGENRRANDYRVRLHAAKYLKMDPLFKELFFPLLSYGKNFGFCSTTGLGGYPAALLPDGTNPTNDVVFTKANGIYRGLALFTVRSDKLAYNDSFKLNSITQDVGLSALGSGAAPQIMRSPYRRFNNGPPMVSQEAQGTQVGNSAPPVAVDAGNTGYAPVAQTLRWTEADNENWNKTEMSISEVGNIIKDIETASLHASSFLPSVGAGGITGGMYQDDPTSTTRQYDQTANTNWDGSTAITSAGAYYPNLRNTTIRIADGKLELDITNGKNSSCLIEVVVNAQKKLDKAYTPQEYVNAVFEAVQYQQNQNRNPHVSIGSNQNPPGGWQAFYDPEYPLLHVKSAHRNKVNNLVNEVHRSSHMLAPGQTKRITMQLGSLYYQLGNKTTTSDLQLGTVPSPEFGPGSLLIAIGHSGVSQLSMPTANTDNVNHVPFSIKPDVVAGSTHTIPGTGFWVGKQKAPSEIVVQGRYEEKFYPSYCITSERSSYDDTTMMPPAIYTANPNGVQMTNILSSGLPVQETIGVVDATDQAVAAKVASSSKGA